MSFSYKSLSQDYVACPICGGKDFTQLARHDRYSMGINTAGCLGCGLIMTNPMPADDDLNDFYQHHYRRVYRKVNKPTLSHIKEYALDARARYLVDYLVRNSWVPRGARVLDVGCAEGSVVAEIGRRVADVELVGVEPGIDFADFARKHGKCTVHPSLNDVDSCSRPFNLIIVNHVLEHVRDPVRFLKDLKSHLGEGGVIYVDVPDVLEYRSLDDLHLAHLYHFSSRTLSAAAAAAGLAVVEMQQHSPPRHPKSIRCVLSMRQGNAISPIRKDDFHESFALLKSIESRAWRYALKRNIVWRIIVGGPRKLGRLLFRQKLDRV